MKQNKIFKIVIGFILIFAFITLCIIIYFYKADIQSKPPKEITRECYLEETIFKNRKVFSITKKNGPTNSYRIIYLHGGSYVAEADYKHWKFVEDLAKDTGATIILPDYPLTPKYTYKSVFKMMEPLYKSILEDAGAENIILMGDSAGGGLSLALLEKMGTDGEKQPAKVILLSPWLDVTMTNPKIDEVQKQDPILIKDTLKLAGIAYAGKDGLTSYLVNPLHGPLENLKNITIYTGTNDILNPDVHKLVGRAEEIGLSIDVREFQGATHTWMLDRGRNRSELAQATYEDILQLLLEEINKN